MMHPSALWSKFGDPNGPGLELVRASYIGFVLPHSWPLIQEREQIGNPNDKLACQLRKAAEDYEAKVEDAVHGHKIAFEVIDPVDGETKSKAGFFVDLTGGWIVQPKSRQIHSVISEKPPRARVTLETQINWWREVQRGSEWATLQKDTYHWFTKKAIEELRKDERFKDSPDPDQDAPTSVRCDVSEDYAFHLA
jgi:hypothetical protein